MLKIPFICPLENGLHARPASELEQRASAFDARIELCNLRNQRRADARSVLAMIGADAVYQDPCELLIDGHDEEAAYQALSRFIHDEFADCDTPVAAAADRPEQPLPMFLAQTTSAFVRGNGVSPGLAQGTTLLLGTVDLQALAQQQEPEEPAVQHKAMQHALAQVRQQLR